MMSHIFIVSLSISPRKEIVAFRHFSKIGIYSAQSSYLLVVTSNFDISSSVVPSNWRKLCKLHTFPKVRISFEELLEVSFLLVLT